MCAVDFSEVMHASASDMTEILMGDIVSSPK